MPVSTLLQKNIDFISNDCYLIIVSKVEIMTLKNIFISLFVFSFSVYSYGSHEHIINDDALKDESSTQRPYVSTDFNVTWFNPKFDPDQTGLFKNGEEARQIETLVDWAKQNADLKFPINVWYDSITTSKEALANTQNHLALALKEIQEKTQEIRFRDIWSLDYISKYSSAFDSRQNIYFKSDLARMAILLRYKDSAFEETPRYMVYSDLNIPPISLSAMYTDEKRKRVYGPLPSNILEEFGFALCQNHAGDRNYAYENAFLILDSQHKIACQSLWFGVLEINRERGEVFASRWADWQVSTQEKKCQIVFTSFAQMYKYYKYLKGEYGIGKEPEHMPVTLEARIEKFNRPSSLFEIESSEMKEDCLYTKDCQEKDYVGYQLANKTHPKFGPIDENGYVTKQVRYSYKVYKEKGESESLRDLTIDVNKPISSFYNSRSRFYYFA